MDRKKAERLVDAALRSVAAEPDFKRSMRGFDRKLRHAGAYPNGRITKAGEFMVNGKVPDAGILWTFAAKPLGPGKIECRLEASGHGAEKTVVTVRGQDFQAAAREGFDQLYEALVEGLVS